jgi:hypothetical protein
VPYVSNVALANPGADSVPAAHSSSPGIQEHCPSRPHGFALLRCGGQLCTNSRGHDSTLQCLVKPERTRREVAARGKLRGTS